MATRRDQLQSYQFMVQRVVSAFVMRETDPAQSPLRRGIGGMFASAMIVIIVAAIFGVYGLLTKLGSSGWKVDDAIVVEKETGATFVYREGALHPTLNFTSAVLASGHSGQAAVRVPGKSLAGVPRGGVIGIPGAPDSLPTSVVGAPWTICSVGGGGAEGGKPATTTTSVVGRAPQGNHPLEDGQALLVKESGGDTYLIWRSRRYPIQEPDQVVPALFGATAPVVPVGAAWLDTLTAGMPIAPITIRDYGQASPAVANRKIGDVLVAQTGNTQSYWLVLNDGLAPITELQKDVLAGQYPGQPVTVNVFDTRNARQSAQIPQPSGDVAPPQAPPTLVAPPTTDLICAITSRSSDPPQISTGGRVEQFDAAIQTPARSGTGTVLADRVLVPPGQVAVIRVAETAAYFLITDLGIRYPVPSDQVLGILGYTVNQAVAVPAGLVNRIPGGPSLNQRDALQPAKTSGGG